MLCKGAMQELVEVIKMKSVRQSDGKVMVKLEKLLPSDAY